MISQEELELANPGFLLKEELSKIIQYDPAEKAGFITRVDDALLAEGQLSRIIYESTLNYLVRRLITVAEYFKRKYYDTTDSDNEYWSKLRLYLRDYTNIPASKQERVFSILLRCVWERNRVPSDGTHNAVIKRAKSQNARCYICGREVIYDRHGDDPYNQRAEVEHIWPKTLGGSNNETNLTIACERCNKMKDDYIDYSDFHYEEVCAVTDESMGKSFPDDFNWSYRLPVLAKSGFVCAEDGCDRDPRLHGELQLQRVDPFDSWHFLNVDAYCDRHAPRR